MFMCKYLTILILSGLGVLITGNNFAQGISINNSGAAADNSAILDITTGNAGVLIPRIALTDTSDATTIPAPAHSLIIYNTGIGNGLTEAYYYNDGTGVSPHWIEITPNPVNQDLNLAGNKIINLATCTNDHDAANKAYVDALIAGGGGGSGTGCCGPTTGATELSQPSATAYKFIDASIYCDTLTEGGHTDWYIPTNEEIVYLIILNPSVLDLNDPGTNYFWTSTWSDSSDGMIVWQWGTGGQWAWSQAVHYTAKAKCAR